MIHIQLRTVTVREMVSALERDGFKHTSGKGGHRVYRHADRRRVTIAYHKTSSTFPPKTLKEILEATHWTNDDLKRLKLIR